MARDLSPAVASAILGQSLQPAFFVTLTMLSETVYIWSGLGSIVWGGVTWQGVGGLGEVSTIEEGGDVQARGITLTLSGINPSLLHEILDDYSVGLPASVQLGLFDGSGNILTSPIMQFAGRTDQPSIMMNGETATISVNCESLLMSMNTSCERRYTAEDQNIDYPTDLGFSYVNSIQDITIFWGRVPSSNNNFAQQGTSGG